jgi:hypothetical protein
LINFYSRQEFIEFFGLNANPSKISPTSTSTATTSQSSNGKTTNNVTKANGDEPEEPTTPVI